MPEQFSRIFGRSLWSNLNSVSIDSARACYIGWKQEMEMSEASCYAQRFFEKLGTGMQVIDALQAANNGTTQMYLRHIGNPYFKLDSAK